MTYQTGPYVAAALFCESVLEEKTGVLSIIRIVDTLTHNSQGANPPNDMPSFTHTMFLVISLKSGMARGRNELRVQPQQPDGSTKEEINFTFHFEGDEKGQNVIVQIAYQFEMEGLYWFKVFLEKHQLTAIPLRVRYNRVVIGTRSAPPA